MSQEQNITAPIRVYCMGKQFELRCFFSSFWFAKTDVVRQKSRNLVTFFSILVTREDCCVFICSVKLVAKSLETGRNPRMCRTKYLCWPAVLDYPWICTFRVNYDRAKWSFINPDGNNTNRKHLYWFYRNFWS